MKNKIIKLAVIPAVIIGIAAQMFLSSTSGTIQIVTAKEKINPGVKVSESMLALTPIPKTAVPPGAVTDIKKVLGKRLSTARVPGDMILEGVINEKDFTLNDDETFMPIEIPQSIADFVSEGTNITIITLPGNNLPSQIVEKLPVCSVVTLQEAGGKKIYAVVKAKIDQAVVLSPYMPQRSYQVIVVK